MKGFLRNGYRFRNLSIFKEPKLLRGNKLVQKGLEPKGSDLCNNLVYQVAQGDRTKISEGCRFI